MDRSGDSSGLLTAPNPNALLQRSDLGRYTSVRQLDAIGTMTRATVTKANAVSRARTAVALRTKLTGEANTARLAAGQAVAIAKGQRVTLVAQRGSYERQLTVAGEALTGLKNKRAAYLPGRRSRRRSRRRPPAGLGSRGPGCWPRRPVSELDWPSSRSSRPGNCELARRRNAQPRPGRRARRRQFSHQPSSHTSSQSSGSSNSAVSNGVG